jgi:cell wall-associated NlpC family hydrolase
LHNRDLIGIPFIDGGRDPKVGLDCWGMAMHAAGRFGYRLPDFTVACLDALKIGSTVAVEIRSGRWQKLDEPIPGCIVIMSIDPEAFDIVNHLGVYIGNGDFVHTLLKMQSFVSSIHGPYWKNKIRGYYRWNQINCS